ncbi:MAG: hypothetical protein WBA18_03600 [Terracidiphilus sp.]
MLGLCNTMLKSSAVPRFGAREFVPFYDDETQLQVFHLANPTIMKRS